MTKVTLVPYQKTVENQNGFETKIAFTNPDDEKNNGSLFSNDDNGKIKAAKLSCKDYEENPSFFDMVKSFFSNIANFFSNLFSNNKKEAETTEALEYDGKIGAVTMGKGSNEALFTSISALNSTIDGINLIKDSLNYDDKGVEVNFRGVDSSYYITNEELQAAKDDEKYSNDIDMLSFELALEKLKEDIINEEYSFEGGIYYSINNTEEILGILTGKTPKKVSNDDLKIDELEIDGIMQEALVASAKDNIMAKDFEGNNQELQKFGEYTIRSISGETVILIDPHSPGKLIEVPFVSFMNNFSITKADTIDDNEKSFYLAKADKSTVVNDDGTISNLSYDKDGRILSETKKDKNGNLIEENNYSYDINDPTSYTKTTNKTEDGAKVSQSLTYKNNKLIEDKTTKYDKKTNNISSTTENSYLEDGSLKETYIVNYAKANGIKNDKTYIWYNQLGEKTSEFIETNYENGKTTTEAYSYNEYNIETGKYDLTVVQKDGFEKNNGSFYVSYDKNGNATYKPKDETDRKILEKRLEPLGFKGWHYRTIMDIIEKKDYLTSSIIACEKYEQLNEVIFGKRQDTALEKELKALSEAYGIEIYSDNDLLSEEYAKANGIMSSKTVPEGFCETLKEGFEQMKKHNQTLPKEIYLTELFAKNEDGSDIATGVFSRPNPDSIALNVDLINDNNWLKTVLYHESAHLADYKNGQCSFLSDDNTVIRIDKNTQVFNTNPLIKASDIEKFIGEYALTNNQEFVAEISALITSDVIVLDKNGKYTINEDKIVNNSYIGARNSDVSWYNTQKEIDTLNSIMALYDIMTEKKISLVSKG